MRRGGGAAGGGEGVACILTPRFPVMVLLPTTIAPRCTPIVASVPLPCHASPRLIAFAPPTQNAFPTYLGVAAEPDFSLTRSPAAGGSAAASGGAPAEGGRELECCTLTMHDNPLARWVELPDGAEDLRFSNMLCGIIQGAMAAIMYKVEATFVEDTLRGDARNRIRVVLSQVLKDTAAEEYRAE